MKPDDLDPTLMMQPLLNKIIMLANESIVCSERIRRSRLNLSTTHLYHTVLDKIFSEAKKAIFNKRKGLHYPSKKYLANIEIRWLPDVGQWKVVITNGGTKRKNAKLRRKVCHKLCITKVMGIYTQCDERKFS